MWHGFFGQRIASGNKGLMRLGQILMIIAAIGVVVASRGIVNWYEGPARVSESVLASTSYPMFALRNFVRVDGDKAVPTGVTETTTETNDGRVQSEWVSADFVVLRIGRHLLLVKSRHNAAGASYQGTLTDIPDDVRQSIINQLPADLQGAFVPAMLDASKDYDDFGMIQAAGLLLLVPVAIGVILTARKRSTDYSQHPLAKAIARVGPLESVVPEIEGEIASGFTNFGSSFFQTKNWVVSVGAKVFMRKNDLVWAFMKRTKTTVHAIPAGTSYSVVLKDSRGAQIEGGGLENDVAEFLRTLNVAMPWVIIGYTADLEKAYIGDLAGFSAAVAQRRAEFKRAAAAH